jgi:hypothetical protein
MIRLAAQIASYKIASRAYGESPASIRRGFLFLFLFNSLFILSSHITTNVQSQIILPSLKSNSLLSFISNNQDEDRRYPVYFGYDLGRICLSERRRVSLPIGSPSPSLLRWMETSLSLIAYWAIHVLIFVAAVTARYVVLQHRILSLLPSSILDNPCDFGQRILKTTKFDIVIAAY